MELHKAIKEIVASKGAEMITNVQIINYLLDYQAFKEKPATKLILRDVINAGYGESILALQNDKGWQIKLKQYQHDFIDSCGYKEDLAVYVFESLAYALGLNVDGNQEPEVKSGFNVDSFFDIPEVEVKQPTNAPQNTPKQNADPTDLYTIAQTFFNEEKYQQARSFIEKAIYSQPAPSKIAHMLRLLGDILMMLGHYEDAIKIYNECFNRKAIEGRYEIDILKDYLNKHKIKGYENVMFNYFFCLYGAKKINDTQWLQLVKGEARFGLLDAIRYCADNGINPIEDHFDIYFVDRSQLKTGDYLYADGSFSHEMSTSKDLLARILLTSTSEFEKYQGWDSGYIIPISPIGNGYIIHKLYEYGNIGPVFMWSTERIDLPFPHSHYTIDDLTHWGKIEKIDSEHLIKINNYNEYPAFGAVDKLNEVKPVPISGASQWFLPSIGFFEKIKSYNYLLPYGARICWTSSQSDQDNAIIYTDALRGRCEKKNSKHPVLPIAAF